MISLLELGVEDGEVVGVSSNQLESERRGNVRLLYTK